MNQPRAERQCPGLTQPPLLTQVVCSCGLPDNPFTVSATAVNPLAKVISIV